MDERDSENIIFLVKTKYLPFLLVVIGFLAYSNSFNGPFIFDDIPAIEDNLQIRQLSPLTKALSPPVQTTVAGRPIVNLTFAINYAISGYKVWSYHLFNLLIHILAAITLYGIVRWTLQSERLKRFFGDRAELLAWIVAAIWLVHPVQTESVTYIVQRTESLMGLFYLLTLYTAIRAIQSQRPAVWSVFSVVCCGLGMATKEVMVTAPLLVLCYDRFFCADSFKSALRRRWAFYVGLAATWGIVFALISAGPRSSSVGFDISVSPLSYAMSQPGIVVHYIRLCFWPHPLCLDYHWLPAETLSQILLPMIVVLALIAVTLWGLIQNRSWSYPFIWFFVILAPTSSFVPIADLAYEHRLYLSLAGVVVAFVVGVYILMGRLVNRFGFFEKMLGRLGGFVLTIVLLAVLILTTISRNNDYRTAESIWRTVLACAPLNPRAHASLGAVFSQQNRLEEAVNCYRKAIEIKPDYADAHNNLGLVLKSQGRFNEAIEHYHKALELKPNNAQIYNNLGGLLQSLGNFDEAIGYFNRALELDPDSAEMHYNLGIILKLQGRLDEAIEHYRQAVKLKADYAEAYYNLANALSTKGDLDEAIEYYRRALELSPESVEAHNNLAIALKKKERFDEAIVFFRNALQFNPDYIPSLNGLSQLLVTHPDPRMRNAAEAISLAERAAELTNYNNVTILDTLAACYASAGRYEKAGEIAEKAFYLANTTGNNDLANYILKKLQSYKQAKQ